MQAFLALLIQDIAAPVQRRLGHAIGGFLAGIGASTEQTQTVLAGVAAFLAVVIDLILSGRRRRKAAK